MNEIMNYVPISQVAPWYYLEENIVHISLYVLGLAIIVSLILIIINFIKNKKIHKKMLIFLLIISIIFILLYTGPAEEYILNPILKKIYGY